MREESKHEILLESGTNEIEIMKFTICLLYTSPSPRDRG